MNKVLTVVRSALGAKESLCKNVPLFKDDNDASGWSYFYILGGGLPILKARKKTPL